MAFELQAIDHIVLRSSRIDEMLAFYCTVLGAQEERRLEHEGLYQLRAGRSLIDIVDTAKPLGRAAGEPPRGRAPNLDHFCLTIKPWREAELLSYLDDRGIAHSAVEQRYGAEGFCPSVYIVDPEGNTIELKAAAD